MFDWGKVATQQCRATYPNGQVETFYMDHLGYFGVSEDHNVPFEVTLERITEHVAAMGGTLGTWEPINRES